MKTMKVIICDDASMHQGMIEMCLKSWARVADINLEIFKKCSNGDEAFVTYQGCKNQNIKIDLITLDIRMPIQDGLTTLLKIKTFDPFIKVVMASSEDEQTVKRKNPQIAAMSDKDKQELLQRVIDRIVLGKKEPGKINFLLEACEELHIDPIGVAKALKANGYLHKPYKAEKVQEVMTKVFSGSGFVM